MPAARPVTLTVRLMPRAGADRIIGLETDERGLAVLKVAVTAAPVDGAANAALIKLLAKQLDLPKSAITLVAGAGARIKRLALVGDEADIADRLRRFEGVAP
jgi:uncharacterized protein YggU (UPF0235/DUF167 family)